MGPDMSQKIWKSIRKVLVYQEPSNPVRFVLPEREDETSPIPADQAKRSGLDDVARELDELLRYARELLKTMAELRDKLRQGQATDAALAEIKRKVETLTTQRSELNPLLLAYTNSDVEVNRQAVSASLAENEHILREMYHLPLSKDLIIRHLQIAKSPPVPGFIAFTDGLCDKYIVNEFVLQPMMQQEISSAVPPEKLADHIVEHILLSNQASTAEDYVKIRDALNYGDTLICIDGCPQAIIAETKGWEHRPVDRPQIEQTIRGSQEAFGEILRINTALIRKNVRTSDLVTEMINIGERVPSQVALMYLESVANPLLVKEVRRRLGSITVDYINDVGILEQLIIDHPGLLLPQTLSTERPDRVGVHLAEGRVAILFNGNPFAHIIPVSFFSFFHNPEDFNLYTPVGTFMRIIRYVGAAISLLLPSLYLAITLFHQEALPTDMALAIAGARERVPFPGFIEILLMEFSFELIREAGLRVPGILGSTIGIVGAIILGQAAVTAHIVSPVMVVIIAVTGLASYTIPEFRMSAAVRIMRFGYLVLSATLGLVGIASGLVLMATVMASMKSFGMPYLTPLAPKTVPNLDIVARGPVFRQERRPDALNPKDMRRQPNLSRNWPAEEPEGENP